MSSIEYAVVVTGSLPVNPYLTYDPDIAHLCTTTIVYFQEDHLIVPGKVIICDPGWTNKEEERLFIIALSSLGLIPADITYMFLTHRHFDHYCGYAGAGLLSHVVQLTEKHLDTLEGLKIVSLPGHSKDSKALFFSSNGMRVAVAGDTVINEEYLLCWEVYRPNGYSQEEISQTREAMTYLLDNCDIIIPGHGAPIIVDRIHRNSPENMLS